MSTPNNAPSASPQTARTPDQHAPPSTPDHDTALASLQQQLAEASERNAALQRTFELAESRRLLERELALAGAFDIDAAVVLTQAARPDRPHQPTTQAEARRIAHEMRRDRPYLFRTARAWPGSGVMAHADDDDQQRELQATAEIARSTGDPRALQRFLRLRRGI